MSQNKPVTVKAMIKPIISISGSPLRIQLPGPGHGSGTLSRLNKASTAAYHAPRSRPAVLVSNCLRPGNYLAIHFSNWCSPSSDPEPFQNLKV
jgi:hypothetical protein